MSLGQYLRFLVVGTFVGVITVGCRELIGHLLAEDTPRNYTISIAVAYTIGMALSFLLNHRFTFDGDGKSRNWRVFFRFAAIASVGIVTTWILSLALRYGTNLDALIGPAAKPAAFAAATVLSTFLTYPLNSRFVFGRRRSAEAATECAS
jgi:putative flippase GtrA